MMAKITFNDISIENFGPFRERQTLNLSVYEGRPVVLIKALNGSGKTTLLTALQIALYGYKAISLAKKSEYEHLVQSLQREDATGHSRIDVSLTVEAGDQLQSICVRREWITRNAVLHEVLTVSTHGEVDLAFTEEWDEFINNILPAELVQLFLFDGEKIEALANPERLPDLLRRATEVFLGLGGIDALANDLKAVERRAYLRKRDGGQDHHQLQEEVERFSNQLDETEQRITILMQQRAECQNQLDQANQELNRFTLDAQRNGLSAYEKAAELKNALENAKKKETLANLELIEAIEDPLLPLAWLGSFWDDYKAEWELDQHAQHAQLLLNEFAKRDQRLLQAVSLPEEDKQSLELTLANDLKRFATEHIREPIFQPGGNPHEVQIHLDQAIKTIKKRATAIEAATREVSKAEQVVGEIPAEEQLASVFEQLRAHSKLVASTEAKLNGLNTQLNEAQTYMAHIGSRLNASQKRLREEFKDKTLEQQGLAAANRAKKTLAVFRERLLASKAQWLSTMITESFLHLLRKKRLIAKVLVDPQSYAVSIIDAAGHALPMERLSAGERQILAISVLSALIRERKGRFPVVVDTPLARLDNKHRESLIKNFFGMISHQVLVLSTDEEVHGHAYIAMQPFMSAEMALEFDEQQRSTKVQLVNKA